MVSTPGAKPVTIPVAGFTVAIEVLELDQVPPNAVLDKVTLLPAQKEVVPVIGATPGFTVTTAVSADVHVPFDVVAM